MKKCLVSAFEPFEGREKNASYEVLKRLESYEGVETILLPVEYEKAPERLIERIKEREYGAVLSLGQAAGRKKVSIETIGINLRNGKIADNAGKVVRFTKIDPSGPDGLFTTLPLLEIVDRFEETGLGTISYSAGTYVCNDVLYSLLNTIQQEKLDLLAGFVHVPLLKEQDEQTGMDLENMLKAIEICLEEIQKKL